MGVEGPWYRSFISSCQLFRLLLLVGHLQVQTAAVSQSSVYLLMLQMLKMFPIGLDTCCTPSKHILAVLVLWMYGTFQGKLFL